MARRGVSMRWWLALAFVLVASLTAVAVSELSTRRSEQAFRERAIELAVGQTVSAARAAELAIRRGDLEGAMAVIAARRRASVFVVDSSGRLVTDRESHGVSFEDVPDVGTALATAVSGSRFVESYEDGNAFVVGLRLDAPGTAAIITYTSRPDLRAELGIIRDEIPRAALLAAVVGALAGVLIAMTITARLRRIGAAAAAIEAGDLETPLQARFGDELGALARTIDRMRERLRESFQQLEYERDRLRRLLEGLQEGVVAVDRDANVTFANAAARRLLPRSLQEGAKLPEPWPRTSLTDLAERLFGVNAAVVQSRVGDGAHTYSLVGIPAAGGDEAILVLTDISERERRERAEREFVANAAHELRTPLAAIASSVEVLQGGAKYDPAERDQFLGVIERQAERLGRLSRALLTLARAQTHQEAVTLEPVELRPLLSRAAADLGPLDGVTVEVDCAPGLAALAQRDLVEQVVTSLAANAAKYTSAGRIRLAAAHAGGAVVVEVSDTGSGIEPAARERVFDRFYRIGRDGSADGFGLGLAIVREAVRAIGGVIEIESEAGAGTTVRVVLAAAEERAA